MRPDVSAGQASNGPQQRAGLDGPRGDHEVEWIEAGFFIVSDGDSPATEKRLLPARTVTVSTCIAESYPDAWALPWVETSSQQLREIRESLALDDSTLSDLRSWVGQAMDDGSFGWPNVFFSLHAAREFRSRFLGAGRESRIVGLGLAMDVAAEFRREEAPQEGRGGPGVWTMLTRGVPLIQHGTPLGFDVLGAEFDGSFHTFSCNGLQQEFNEQLGITFNEYGLIGDYSSTVAACEYTNRDDVGAEPVAWYPFRVDDHPVEEAR